MEEALVGETCNGSDVVPAEAVSIVNGSLEELVETSVGASAGLAGTLDVRGYLPVGPVVRVVTLFDGTEYVELEALHRLDVYGGLHGTPEIVSVLV